MGVSTKLSRLSRSTVTSRYSTAPNYTCLWQKHRPRGSIYIAIMELGPPNHNGDGLLGANSIIHSSVYGPSRTGPSPPELKPD